LVVDDDSGGIDRIDDGGDEAAVGIGPNGSDVGARD
jgi:hypothetical protein